METLIPVTVFDTVLTNKSMGTFFFSRVPNVGEYIVINSFTARVTCVKHLPRMRLIADTYPYANIFVEQVYE